MSQSVSLARLSPSGLILAAVPTVSRSSAAGRRNPLISRLQQLNSNALLYNIRPRSTPGENCLRFRSRAAHSVRLRSVSWRPTDDSAEYALVKPGVRGNRAHQYLFRSSGPILCTQTIDGVFRLWGCVIDEPDFFSLWTSLDVHAILPKQLPLATMYWRTRKMDHTEDPARRGTEDDFVTVFTDGSVHLTTVSNFDCRPPACLTQSTVLLQEGVFTPSQLSNFRYPSLVPSRSNPSSFHLIGRCSRGILVHARATLPPSLPSSKLVFHDAPTRPPVNLVGKVKKLVRTFCGEAMLVLGDNGRVQSWELGAEEAVVTESFVAEPALSEGARFATWHDGRMLAAGSGTTLSVFEFRPNRRLRLLDSLDTIPHFDEAPCFFVARTDDDSLSTTIVAVTKEGSDDWSVNTWTYSAATHRIHEGATQSLSPSLLGSEKPKLVFCAPVPVPIGVRREEISIVTADEEGTLRRWSMLLGETDFSWEEGPAIETGKNGVVRVACSSDGNSALATSTPDGTERELSIWDTKASEFSSGEQFSQPLSEPVISLEWSIDGSSLALATPSEVSLYCAQRLDDLSGCASWAVYATLTLSDILSSPISNLCWLSAGLALASSDHLFFYSFKMDTGEDARELVRARIAPLPLHHPQLLFQALLSGMLELLDSSLTRGELMKPYLLAGHFHAVVKILASLASQLDEDGSVTPILTERSTARVTIDDFLGDPEQPTKVRRGRFVRKKRTHEAVVLCRLVQKHQTSSSPSRPRIVGTGQSQHHFSSWEETPTYAWCDAEDRDDRAATLSDSDVKKLLAALDKKLLIGLSDLEHEHLAIVARTVHETQNCRGSIDPNGLRYLVSLRSSYLYEAAVSSTSTSTTLNGSRSSRLKYRDILWAFHSDSQDLLLEESTKAAGGKLTWQAAKTLGLGMWLKSRNTLTVTIEAIGRTEFMKPDQDDRDPVSAMLFYLALRKKHIVVAFWKQASGHPEQRQLLKFLANDFDEPRWKSAALKNAFALKDAVNVCLRQLDDFQLAIALARTYEGDDGPVLKTILEQTVVPMAFQKGFRWLGSWAFWMLKRRDLAIQIIFTPLPALAVKLPYKIEAVSNPLREDPALVLLFSQLRSWSLQTVKGAIAVPGRTEFNFVLHISRILWRMGCHVLALNLLRTYSFQRPSTTSASVARPTALHDRRHSLLYAATKLDLSFPPSAQPSRVASPALLDEHDEEQRRKIEFREVINKVRVEAKAPAEFSFDAFNF
ncbi:SPOSA6832_04497 [Sporobolomyces salmonicolor]|uniref:SPOSA6832_04497-mRNA-1:cds n=1 Tax=Sporidiobolus salmonicolor TaxID=5005 RepID=A0A0D6ESW8_SPOSA|nr:SPOSA6832_04497 [Sporobolomyces salmonicolor]